MLIAIETVGLLLPTFDFAILAWPENVSIILQRRKVHTSSHSDFESWAPERQASSDAASSQVNFI